MTGETGSYRYMAPEVFGCQGDYNEKIDQYSFAVILWELFEVLRVVNVASPEHQAACFCPPTRPTILFHALVIVPTTSVTRLLCFAQGRRFMGGFDPRAIAQASLQGRRPVG